MRICGKPRHHDSKKQVQMASLENSIGANPAGSGRVPQSGLVQWGYCAIIHRFEDNMATAKRPPRGKLRGQKAIAHSLDEVVLHTLRLWRKHHLGYDQPK
jgi:hypothetical protein